MPQAWQFLISPLKSHWQALRAAREKAALAGDQISESSILVRVERVELASLPWEGSIIAVIRYPQDIAIVGHFLREDNLNLNINRNIPLMLAER